MTYTTTYTYDYKAAKRYIKDSFNIIKDSDFKIPKVMLEYAFEWLKETINYNKDKLITREELNEIICQTTKIFRNEMVK